MRNTPSCGTGTTYGIALYDHIALDGSKIHENDLIN